MIMEHKLIKTENYLLVINDDQIKEGDWFLANQIPYKCLRIEGGSCPYIVMDKEGKEIGHHKSWENNIIAHLPLNNSLILEGVDLLPPIESEDVEKLAREEYKDNLHNPFFSAAPMGYVKGYKKAKEKYKYTEKDMRKAIVLATTSKYDYKLEFCSEDEIIQSLSQPKMPVAFERKESGFVISGGFRMGDENQPPGLQTHITYNTTSNSQGQTVWVGKYIY